MTFGRSARNRLVEVPPGPPVLLATIAAADSDADTHSNADEIAAVAREHYQPLGPSDDVPSEPLSVAVALAA